MELEFTSVNSLIIARLRRVKSLNLFCTPCHKFPQNFHPTSVVEIFFFSLNSKLKRNESFEIDICFLRDSYETRLTTSGGLMIRGVYFNFRKRFLKGEKMKEIGEVVQRIITSCKQNSNIVLL